MEPSEKPHHRKEICSKVSLSSFICVTQLINTRSWNRLRWFPVELFHGSTLRLFAVSVVFTGEPEAFFLLTVVGQNSLNRLSKPNVES